MPRLARGELYNPHRTQWPEGTHWVLSPDGVELLIMYRKPSGDEINAIRRGPAQFALLAGEQALILCHRFGALAWADTPWQATLQRREGKEPGLVGAAPGQHLLMQTVLLDANTGIIKGLRGTTWPEPFVTAVRAAIGQQLASAAPDRGGAQIDAWYQRFPTTNELVANADMVIAGGS